MGIILNPLVFRLGHSKSWFDSWYLYPTEYVEFLHNTIFLKNLLYYIFFKFYPTRFSYWLFSHIEISIYNNKFFINLFVYEASNKFFIVKFLKILRFGMFKSLRLKTFWLKKKLFDKNYIGLSFFNFLKFFFFNFNKLKLVYNKVESNKNLKKKLAKLKFKYGKDWIGKEEIAVFSFFMSFFFSSFSSFNFKFIYNYYKYVFFFSKKKTYNNIYFLEIKNLIFFFCVLKKLFSKWINNKSKKFAFNSKIIFHLLRFFIIYFHYKPFFKQIKKYIEVICSFASIDTKVNVFLLENYNLNSRFISRYIMLALKNGFNYYDIIYPIKRTLSSYMFYKTLNRFDNIKLLKKRKTFFQIKNNFYKSIALLSFNIYFKIYNIVYNKYKNYFLFYINNYKIISLRKRNFVFKRFYSKKILIKKNFLNRYKDIIIKEKIEQEKREKRKPLTQLQRNKYNYSRRQKRYDDKLKKKFLNDNIEIKRFSNSLKEKKINYGLSLYFLKKFKSKGYFIKLNEFFNKTKTKTKTKKNRVFKKVFNNNIILKRYYITYEEEQAYFKSIIDNLRQIEVIEPKKKINKKNKKDKFIIPVKRRSFLIRRPSKIINKLLKFKFYLNNYNLMFLKKIFQYIKIRLYKNNFINFFFNLLNSLLNNLNICYKKNILNLVNMIDIYWAYFKEYLKKNYIKEKNNKKFFDLKLYSLFIYRIKIMILLLLLILSFLFKKNFKNRKVIIIFIKGLIFFFTNKRIILTKKFYMNLYNQPNEYKMKLKNYTIKYNIIFCISNGLNKFFLDIKQYFKYIMNYNNLNIYFFKNINLIKKQFISFNNRSVRSQTRTNLRTHFFGYKFHFLGRFTRKQQSASMWFRYGFLPTSTMNADVDYDFHTIPLKYSSCTLRVWIYKGFYSRKAGWTFKNKLWK